MKIKIAGHLTLSAVSFWLQAAQRWLRLPQVLICVWCATPLALAGPNEPRLNLYNWSDYIAKDTVAGFEKQTGIKARYDVYDSADTLQAKLLTGRSGYDVVTPPAIMLAGCVPQTFLSRLINQNCLT